MLYANNVSKLMQYKAIRQAINLLVLYGVSIVITDLVREVPTADTIRAVAGVLFLFLLLITSGVILIGRTHRISYIFLGLACGAILHWQFNTADDPYDFTSSGMLYAYYVFRVSPALAFTTPLVAYVLFEKGMKVLAIVLMIAMMMVAVYLTTRSACFSWLIAVVLGISSLSTARVDYRAMLYPGRKMILAGFSLFVLSYSSYFIYKELATLGYLGSGEKAKENLKDLSSSIGFGPIGLLMKGRTEVLASMLMIRDFPIIGTGTSSNTVSYYAEAFGYVGKEGGARAYISADGQIRVGHSMIFHSWAANGILTVPFWLFTLYQLYRLSLLLIISKSNYLALLGLILPTILWDIVFSPISVQSRALIPMMICFASMHSIELRNGAMSVLSIATVSNSRRPSIANITV